MPRGLERRSSANNAVRLGVAQIALAFVVSEADALANGDPASHVLPTRDVFLPFDPDLCSAEGRRLDALTEAAKEGGYAIKVAVISRNQDLGTAYEQFGRPQAYAGFLGRELPRPLFEADGEARYRLLVVMPAGLGLYKAGPKESRALERISVRSPPEIRELARTARRSVLQLGRAAGKQVESPPPKPPCPDVGGGSSESSGALLAFLAPVAMLAAAALLLTFSRRRRDDQDAT